MKTEFEFTYICPRLLNLGSWHWTTAKKQVFSEHLGPGIHSSLLTTVLCGTPLGSSLPGPDHSVAALGWMDCEHQSQGTSPLNPVLSKLAPLEQAGPDIPQSTFRVSPPGHFVKIVAVSLAGVCYKANRSLESWQLLPFSCPSKRVALPSVRRWACVCCLEREMSSLSWHSAW